MRLSATIDLYLPGEPVPRSPSLWDRLKRAFGGSADAASGQIRHAHEASLLVADLREALRRLGVTNAVSLIVDGHVVFNDPHGRPDDFSELALALSEHAPVFGGGFHHLRLAVEHEEAGLHDVIEIACASEHAEHEPAATVRVGGRVSDLEPRPGENAEEYRGRIAPLVADTVLLEAHRRQFESFVARLADALRAAFPAARVEERLPEAKVVRPGAEPAPTPAEPTDPAYDPYARYYPNPFENMLSGLLIGSLLSSAFRPPGLMVVHPSGAPLASAEDLDAHSHAHELAPDAPDPGTEILPATSEDEGAFPDGDDADYGDAGGLDDDWF